jgi:hypothetical protein
MQSDLPKVGVASRVAIRKATGQSGDAARIRGDPRAVVTHRLIDEVGGDEKKKKRKKQKEKRKTTTSKKKKAIKT